MWVSYRMGWPANPSNWWSKSPPFKFQPTNWRLTKMSMEHILGYINQLWSDAMNNCTAFAKPLNEWKLIEHNMCGRQVARSPLWWRPCIQWNLFYKLFSLRENFIMYLGNSVLSIPFFFFLQSHYGENINQFARAIFLHFFSIQLIPCTLFWEFCKWLMIFLWLLDFKISAVWFFLFQSHWW